LCALDKEEDDGKRLVKKLRKRAHEATKWEGTARSMHTFFLVLLGLQPQGRLQEDVGGQGSDWATFNFPWLLRLLSGSKPGKHQQSLVDVSLLLWIRSAGTYTLLRSYLPMLPSTRTLENKKRSCAITSGLNLTAYQSFVEYLRARGAFAEGASESPLMLAGTLHVC
jgi:hypothetical protein